MTGNICIAKYRERRGCDADFGENKKMIIKTNDTKITPTHLTVIISKPLLAVTGVIVNTIYTRSTILTCVINAVVDVCYRKINE